MKHFNLTARENLRLLNTVFTIANDVIPCTNKSLRQYSKTTENSMKVTSLQ